MSNGVVIFFKFADLTLPVYLLNWKWGQFRMKSGWNRGEIEWKFGWKIGLTFLVLVIFVSSVCFCIDLIVGNVSSVRSVFALLICSVRCSSCSWFMFGLPDGAISPLDSVSPMVLGGNATLIPAETRDWLRLWISSFTFLTTLTRPRDHESVVAETGGKSCDSMSAKLPDPSFSKKRVSEPVYGAFQIFFLEFLPWSCDIKYSFKESDNICVTSLTALWTAIRSICRCKITFNDSSIISPSTSVTISSRCSFSWNRTHFYEFSKNVSFLRKRFSGPTVWKRTVRRIRRPQQRSRLTEFLPPCFLFDSFKPVLISESSALPVDPKIDITSVGMNEIKNMGARILVIWSVGSTYTSAGSMTVVPPDPKVFFSKIIPHYPISRELARWLV